MVLIPRGIHASVNLLWPQTPKGRLVGDGPLAMHRNGPNGIPDIIDLSNFPSSKGPNFTYPEYGERDNFLESVSLRA